MAIRKRKHAHKKMWSYQVYWNNPHTKRRESRTFALLSQAKIFDAHIKHRLKYEKESFSIDQNTLVAQDITLKKLVTLYLQEKRFTPKLTTLFISGVKAILEQFGAILVADIQPNFFAVLQRYLGQRRKKDNTFVSQAYVHAQLSKIRTVLRWGHEQGLLVALPKMKLHDPQYARTIPPSPDELSRLLAVAPPHLLRVIILGAFFGCRVGPSEVFALTWDKVDFAAGVIRIDTSRKNPRSPWREVPIRKDCRALLLQWLKEDTEKGVSYLVTFNGHPIQSIHSSWIRAVKEAGIQRRIRPYDLRHSFASGLIAAGVDVGTVAQLLNHSSPQMIFKHYQYVETKQKRQAVELLPPIMIPSTESSVPCVDN